MVTETRTAGYQAVNLATYGAMLSKLSPSLMSRAIFVSFSHNESDRDSASETNFIRY